MIFRLDSTANNSEYQEYFLGVKGGRCLLLTTLLASYANCLEIWEHQILPSPNVKYSQ